MLDDRDVRRLLLSTASRDATAFEQLYRKTAPLLLAVALRIVGRRELAEEVLHDGFLKIWHSARNFDPTGEHPVAWMVALGRHLNRPLGTVKSWVRRALQNLRARVESGIGEARAAR